MSMQITQGAVRLRAALHPLSYICLQSIMFVGGMTFSSRSTHYL
ncbi:MAG: hypothetical protein U9N07_05435 [Euryarchaeota archaeon]|nr:hypothetical protein [Euryarchaeota archaeon]